MSSNWKILKSNTTTQYKVLGLFSGAGGSALGFHNAGLQHALLTDIDNDCIATLNNNQLCDNIIHDDINNMCFRKYKNYIDIVEGGFPCQAFSYAGKSLGFNDTRGTLFYQFARCIQETKPKIAIAENVRGIINHDNGRTLKTIINTLSEIGYNIEYRLLKAQYFDVPQKRERIFIVAIRNDIKNKFIFPTENDYLITLKDAIYDCKKSVGQLYSDTKKKVLELIPEGGYWKDLPVEIQKTYMGASFYHTGGKTGIARRLAWHEPSLTLTCSPAQKQTERCHPKETRPLNVREYARIQTFPDKWNFCGSISSKYRQIGNAVPCNLAYHIGIQARNFLHHI